MTNMEATTLFTLAKEAMHNAYSPYSNFKVGACLLTKAGKVYTGSNVENASYSGTICAERVAVCNAVSCGEREFSTIAIVSSSGKATFPCGICLQFLSEFSGDLTVLLLDGDKVREYKLNELMPYSFKL